MSLISPAASLCTESTAPFNQPSADIVLRTADDVEFRVHSQILTQASPVFSTMFSLPQPQGSEAASNSTPTGSDSAQSGASATPPVPVPVVDVSEDSATLDLLLRILYPISKPAMEDAATLVPVLQAAQKYEMEWPVQIMSERLRAIMPDAPLQVWAAACRAGLEDVAREASLALKMSLIPAPTLQKLFYSALVLTEVSPRPEALACVDDLENMDGISAADYFRLKQCLHAGKEEVNTGDFTLRDTPTPSESPSELFSTDVPLADVICWPSVAAWVPKVPLHAHQAILSVHSPVLKRRLAEIRSTIGLAEQGPTEALVLHFDEGLAIVSALLDACYHGEDGIQSTPSKIAEVLVAARKYEMAQVDYWACRAWDAATLSDPLSAYFIAINHGLHDLARSAARKTLEKPSANVYIALMEESTALAYHRLLQYRDSCRWAVQEQIRALTQRMPTDLRCNSHTSGAYHCCPRSSTSAIQTALKQCGLTMGLSSSISRESVHKAMEQWIATTDVGNKALLRSTLELCVDFPNKVDLVVADVRSSCLITTESFLTILTTLGTSRLNSRWNSCRVCRSRPNRPVCYEC
ncbi:hypothetical protein BD414DRAFT_478322 [Trametes punicea]|nr:hypothetical protein BD414DRAFT_478322 [Trametes punicea]